MTAELGLISDFNSNGPARGAPPPTLAREKKKRERERGREREREEEQREARKERLREIEQDVEHKRETTWRLI